MDDMRMMTYAEAAAALGVKPDSVQRRARNRRWRRERGNDGLVRVAVPVALLDKSPDNPPDIPGDFQEDVRRLERIVATLETEVRMLREAQADLRADRDTWRDLAQRRWWHSIFNLRSR